MTRRALLATVTTTVLVAAFASTGGSAVASRHHHSETQGVIVWTHRAAPGSEHLMVARADGSHPRPLTAPTPQTTDFDAQVSPDGRWVAFERDTPDTATIHLVHPDGTGDRAVDVGCVDPCVAALSPTWLSSREIAFTLIKGPFDPTTDSAASAVLWSSRLDGSHLRRLSAPGIDGTFEDYYLRVSSDGSYVTFRRLANAAGKAAIFRMDRDGGDLHQLTPYAINAEVNDLSTAENGPTKDLVVFESFGRGDPVATFGDLATVPTTCTSLADCTARIRWLTDNGATGRRNANPQWSPDGRSIVFTDRPSIDVEDANIFTMRWNGTHRQQISTSLEFDYRPTWGVGN